MNQVMMVLRLALDRVMDGADTIAVMLQQVFQLVMCKLKTFRKKLSMYEIEIHDNGIEVVKVEEVPSPEQDV